jgi:type IV pilus assembly PilX-like protein
MSERGVALILVLLVMMTLSALSISLAVMVSTESRVAANYRDGIEVSYAAAAALERVLPELAAEPDLDTVLAGVSVSSFIDGPAGLRRLPDGTFTDLRALTSIVNCGLPMCTDVDLDQVREDRPWGLNNPRWQLYAYGPSTALGADRARVYAIVWVADDPSETDMDPFIDGGGAENPGRGRLSITAHAYGPAGTRRMVEATVARDARGMRVLSWREIR